MEFNDLGAQYRRLQPGIDAAIAAVLAHGRFIHGPEVGRLEAALAGRCGAAHCVAVSSGTDALQIILMGLGIGAGAAVFVPTFTFTATAEAIVNAGASPVFCDVGEGSFDLDPDDLERRIAATARAGALVPRAVLAVDLYGMPADYARLARVADRWGCVVIADAAQSFGAIQGSSAVGTLAAATATSFFPTKPLGCYGDGGAIFTADEELAAAARSIRVHGAGGGKYDIARIGLNARLDTIQAAILLEKLKSFDDEHGRRERLAALYAERVGDVVVHPRTPPGSRSAWAQYTIMSPRRDAIRAALAAAGIPSMIYYPRPMHLQPAYAAFAGGRPDHPNATRCCAEVLSLPLHADLADDDVSRIAGVVRAAA
ncbi:MAG: DegT/DnrJ/EryC1/StrS family aminotransferase [Alphaproteobacteria bacterium]